MATKSNLFVAVAHFANGVKAQIIAAPTDTHAKADLVAACIRSGFEFPCVSVEAFPVDARELKHLLADVPLHVPCAPAVQTIHVGGLLRSLSAYRSSIAQGETAKGRDKIRAFFGQFRYLELDFKGEPE
jgi:hypothetical protein